MDDDGGMMWYAQVGAYQEWLADQAAQVEYCNWLDLLNETKGNENELQRNERQQRL